MKLTIHAPPILDISSSACCSMECKITQLLPRLHVWAGPPGSPLTRRRHAKHTPAYVGTEFGFTTSDSSGSFASKSGSPFI